MKIEAKPAHLYETYRSSAHDDKLYLNVAWSGAVGGECRLWYAPDGGGMGNHLHMTREQAEALVTMLTEALESQRTEA